MTAGPKPTEPPYWAVIFSSQRTDQGEADYQRAAARMEDLAATIPGFIGVESVRDDTGRAITVSYWESRAAIAEWRRHPEHSETRGLGRAEWYESFELHVARVERAATFER